MQETTPTDKDAFVNAFLLIVNTQSPSIQIVANKVEGFVTGNPREAATMLPPLFAKFDVNKLGPAQQHGIVIGLLNAAVAVTKVSPIQVTAFEEQVPFLLEKLLVGTPSDAKLEGKDLCLLTAALTAYATSGRREDHRGSEIRTLYKKMCEYSNRGGLPSDFANQLLRELAHKVVEVCSSHGLLVIMRDLVWR